MSDHDLKLVDADPSVGDQEKLLTDAEAAELLGLSDRRNPVGSIKWLVRTGRLKAIRIGPKTIRFSRSDLRKFVADSRR